jgi:hypothetical protein
MPSAEEESAEGRVRIGEMGSSVLDEPAVVIIPLRFMSLPLEGEARWG